MYLSQPKSIVSMRFEYVDPADAESVSIDMHREYISCRAVVNDMIKELTQMSNVVVRELSSTQVNGRSQ
jgi:hypothetical protein